MGGSEVDVSVAVGGTGVSVGGSEVDVSVAVGGMDVAVCVGSGVKVGGIGVTVGETWVGTAVFVGGMEVDEGAGFLEVFEVEVGNRRKTRIVGVGNRRTIVEMVLDVSLI